MLREHRVRLADVDMNVAEGPDVGPPIVLLHGGSNRWQAWKPILPVLTERWHVFAPDFRGHGGSSWTPGNYSIRTVTDDIVAFLDREVKRPAALVGHSLGAQVALWTAARSPTTVNAVVAGDALPGGGSGDSVARQRDQLDFQLRHAGSGVDVADLVHLMPELPFGRDPSGRVIRAKDVLGDRHPAYVGWAETMKALDPSFVEAVIGYVSFSAGCDTQLLTRIPCPVLILRAEDDGITMADVALALDLLRDGRMVTLPGVGHGLHRQAPDAVLAAVVPFLEATEIR